MPTIKFDKNQYYWGDTMTISYQGATKGSFAQMLTIVRDKVHFLDKRNVEGDGSYTYQIKHGDVTGVYEVRLVEGNWIKSRRLAEVGKEAPIMPPVPTEPKLPKDYIYTFEEAPATMGLEPGIYDVGFTFIGYRAKIVKDVVIQDGRTSTITATMEKAAPPAPQKSYIECKSEPSGAHIWLKEK